MLPEAPYGSRPPSPSLPCSHWGRIMPEAALQQVVLPRGRIRVHLYFSSSRGHQLAKLRSEYTGECCYLPSCLYQLGHFWIIQ